MIAKTEASGGSGLLPEILAFTSSLSLDLKLLREDLVGSLAHLAMLAQRNIIPKPAAQSIQRELVSLWERAERNELTLPAEEDVHMAIEGLLAEALGEPAGLLHTARSRNDQVATDLRLHVREMCALILERLSSLLLALAQRAEDERDTLLPAYTHRQRAQPISLAYLLCGYGAMFVRDVEGFSFALAQADALALGVGAIAGTSLPTDRSVTQKLLRFSRLTTNGLDTVGDRDFALDFTYAAAKLLLHASRLSTDFIDFATSEFGFLKLDGEIACGSSMMPQKKNPDVFELIRGKSGRAVGNLTGLLVTLKGLPGGYNRDLQEDRQPLLETGPLVTSVLEILQASLKRVHFDKTKCLAAIEGDYTQATDLAEALVSKGIPFRTAYQAVGALVRRCQERNLPLSQATEAMAKEIHGALDETTLRAVNPQTSVERKQNAGGTGPASIQVQIAELRRRGEQAKRQALEVPRLTDLFLSLKGLSL